MTQRNLKFTLKYYPHSVRLECAIDGFKCNTTVYH